MLDMEICGACLSYGVIVRDPGVYLKSWGQNLIGCGISLLFLYESHFEK